MELVPHGSIQIGDNALQCFLCPYQIIMLIGQEGISLHQCPVIFNGIDIDITELFDIILDCRDLSLHARQIVHIFILQLCSLGKRDFIFIPHIIDLGIQCLLQSFLLGI